MKNFINNLAMNAIRAFSVFRVFRGNLFEGNMKKVIIGLAVMMSVGISQDLTGYEIMSQALNKSTWQDMQADMQLVLRNVRGDERVRDIAFYSSDDENDLNRMLMRFVAPADVKDTGFLTLETEGKDDEQYLYLPALRRVKKIASGGSGGNFMASDFTYYDIGMPELGDFTYKLLGEDERNGEQCYKIECLPANDQILDDTGYGKIIRWVDKERLNTVFSEYYDRDLTKWKELTVLEFQQIDSVDFATDMLMRDLQTGHSSRMQFMNLQVDTGIPDDFFSVRYLRRGR